MSTRVTVAEAAVLQSFPGGHPWQGKKGKQYQQVGNAVPPRLALHALAEVLGLRYSVEDVTGALAVWDQPWEAVESGEVAA